LNILVTGCAGFIGSHLTERLLKEGHSVVGLDSFTPYYDRRYKETNLVGIKGNRAFKLIESELSAIDLRTVLTDIDFVYHLSAQPGVRASWGNEFQIYIRHNIDATQLLLEAAANCQRLLGLVYASSSSIYGDAETRPTSEQLVPRPISPYGVSKLAAEHLVRLYSVKRGVPAIALRYFTVYGPRQRPDMAFHRFCRAAISDQPIELFGDGTQTRDFTYIDDLIAANLACLREGWAGEIFNIGGGGAVALSDVIEHLRAIHRHPLTVTFQGGVLGDAQHTSADIRFAQARLGYSPVVLLRDGLAEEYRWARLFYA